MLRIFLTGLAAGVLVLPCMVPAQDTPLPNPTYPYAARAAIVNPDQGKMGVYRSLAELTYEAYVNKDDAQAAVLARILEKVWDRGETNLRASTPAVWTRIDKSMDGFIKPLSVGIHQGRADGAIISAAYERYLATLASAD
jgi:hypothetical protein